MLCVLELLEGVRRILEAVENSGPYAVGTAGDAPCGDVLEVVLYVESVRCTPLCKLEAVEVVLEVVLAVLAVL